MAGKARGVGRPASQETCPDEKGKRPFEGEGWSEAARFSLLLT